MLGEKIKLYRENKNMTQSEITDILGVKATTISRYEAGTLEHKNHSFKIDKKDIDMIQFLNIQN